MWNLKNSIPGVHPLTTGPGRTTASLRVCISFLRNRDDDGAPGLPQGGAGRVEGVGRGKEDPMVVAQEEHRPRPDSAERGGVTRVTHSFPSSSAGPGPRHTLCSQLQAPCKEDTRFLLSREQMSPLPAGAWERGWLPLQLPGKQKPWMEISGLPQRGQLPFPGFCPSPLAWLLTRHPLLLDKRLRPSLSPASPGKGSAG